jgi:hypothetical protein
MYDFSDSDKFVEGDTDKIGQWLDSSGNDIHISEITGLEQPLWGTRTLNGLTVAEFNSGQTLESILGIDFDSHEVIMVTDSDITTVSTVISTDFGTAGGIIMQQNSTDNDSLIKGHFNTGTLESAVSSSPRSSVPVIIAQSLGTTNLRVWTDGVETGLSTISGTKPDTLLPIIVGGRFSGGGVKFDGGIGEILIFEKELTNSERTDLYDNYLKPKWGIS